MAGDFSQRLRISSIQDARHLAREFDIIISLVDVDMTSEELRSHFHNSTATHLFFFFEDEEDPTKPGAPTKQHIAAVFEAVSKLNMSERTRILLHCHGGICRSTAMAIGLMLKHEAGLQPFQAYKKVLDIRPQMWPNSLIIKHIDDLLELHGELCKFDAEWKEENLGKFWLAPPQRIKTSLE